MQVVDFSRKPRVEVFNANGYLLVVAYPADAKYMCTLVAKAETSGGRYTISYDKRAYICKPSFKSRDAMHSLFSN